MGGRTERGDCKLIPRTGTLYELGRGLTYQAQVRLNAGTRVEKEEQMERLSCFFKVSQFDRFAIVSHNKTFLLKVWDALVILVLHRHVHVDPTRVRTKGHTGIGAC